MFEPMWGRAAVLAAAVVLLPNAPMAGAASAQETGILEGTVFDATTLEPLEGVTVTLLGSDAVSITDPRGAFTLASIPSGSAQIRLARAGYASSVEDVELTAGESAYVQLSVIELSHVLDALLVEGSQDEPSRTINRVRSDGQPAAQTALELLAARVPGLNLTSAGGGVGAASNLQIRGTSSLSGDGAPLIVLDGVRLNVRNSVDGPARPVDGLWVLGDIPASDVESINVLKGPATTVRYGEGSNGVIEIVTRSAANPDG